MVFEAIVDIIIKSHNNCIVYWALLLQTSQCVIAFF